MASLPQLKKRLRSVWLTVQISDAMKTVASAKYAKLTRRCASAKKQQAARATLQQLLPKTEQVSVEQKPVCYIILGYSRGMCGGYNTALNHEAEDLLKKEQAPYVLVCGSRSATFLSERYPSCEVFCLPDVPDMLSLRPLAARALSLYRQGEVGQVVAVYQAFENPLVQTPHCQTLLPLASDTTGEETPSLPLMLPSKQAVMQAAEQELYEKALLSLALESALSAQAATLSAMRTAADNARKTAEKLENQINRSRQTAVTAGVLETAAGAAEEEEGHGEG